MTKANLTSTSLRMQTLLYYWNIKATTIEISKVGSITITCSTCTFSLWYNLSKLGPPHKVYVPLMNSPINVLFPSTCPLPYGGTNHSMSKQSRENPERCLSFARLSYALPIIRDKWREHEYWNLYWFQSLTWYTSWVTKKKENLLSAAVSIPLAPPQHYDTTEHTAMYTYWL